MGKLTVPRPGTREKLQAPPPPAEIALDADDLEEEVDITEPSGPPVAIAQPVAVAPTPVMIAPPPPEILAMAPPVWLAPPPPLAPVIAPPRPPMRSLAASLSDFERDSIRKSSPPIAERRKQLQKFVASAVGVAWFICIVAIGQMGLRSIIASIH